MIKNYNDFKSDEYLSNERDSMERELRTRKTQRNNVKYELEINLDLIKRQILNSIEQGYDYVLSVGKRKEELEKSTETVFHIEFEDERLGRVRIFKPKDTADKGHYEVNGDYYETSAKDIREFYHLLNQEIKGQPLVVKESLRDKMTPKNDDEIETAFEVVFDQATIYALEWYPEQFDDYSTTYEFFEKYKDNFIMEIEDGGDVEDIAKDIIEGKW